MNFTFSAVRSLKGHQKTKGKSREGHYGVYTSVNFEQILKQFAPLSIFKGLFMESSKSLIFERLIARLRASPDWDSPPDWEHRQLGNILSACQMRGGARLDPNCQIAVRQLAAKLRTRVPEIARLHPPDYRQITFDCPAN